MSQNPCIGGLTDLEGAKQIAKQLFNTYNRSDSSSLSHSDMPAMMIDAYKAMQKGFNPSKADIDTYYKTLDRNGDQKVTLQDIEQLAIKYLVGDGYINNQLSNQEIQQYQNDKAQKSNNNDQLQNRYENNQTYIDNDGNTVTTKRTVVETTQYSTTLTTSQKQKKYNIAEEKLEVARRLFKKFDTDQSGYITEEEVAPLLRATYRNMGIDYDPTENDVKEWIEMTDTDGDGKVSLEEYEKLILNSLQKAGISIQ